MNTKKIKVPDPHHQAVEDKYLRNSHAILCRSKCMYIHLSHHAHRNKIKQIHNSILHEWSLSTTIIYTTPLLYCVCVYTILKKFKTEFIYFINTFFSTKPGGRACLYLQCSPLGHDQNHPYLLFSTASRKNLQICNKQNIKNENCGREWGECCTF